MFKVSNQCHGPPKKTEKPIHRVWPSFVIWYGPVRRSYPIVLLQPQDTVMTFETIKLVYRVFFKNKIRHTHIASSDIGFQLSVSNPFFSQVFDTCGIMWLGLKIDGLASIVIKCKGQSMKQPIDKPMSLSALFGRKCSNNPLKYPISRNDDLTWFSSLTHHLTHCMAMLHCLPLFHDIHGHYLWWHD